jgi:hypothetical protein
MSTTVDGCTQRRDFMSSAVISSETPVEQCTPCYGIKPEYGIFALARA